MAELIQWGLLQFVGAGLLLVITIACARGHQLGTHTRRARRAADHRHRVDQVPTPVERGLPRRARQGGPEPVDHAGELRRRACHPGLPPRGRADPPLPSLEPCAVRLAHAQRRGERLVLRPRRVRRRVRGGADGGRRRVAVAPGHHHGGNRGGLRAAARQPVRTSATAVAAVQHRPVGGGPRCTSCTR